MANKNWRPPGWDDMLKKEIEKISDIQLLEGNLPQALLLFSEAGADAEWQGVKDHIVELSSKYLEDDKMFRVKLLLWLSDEDNNARNKSS